MGLNMYHVLVQSGAEVDCEMACSRYKSALRDRKQSHTRRASFNLTNHTVIMGGGAITNSDVPIVGLTDLQREAVADIDPELVRIGYGVISRQKSETFRQAWRTHWRAAFWSCFLTLALFMEGKWSTRAITNQQDTTRDCWVRSTVFLNSETSLASFATAKK